MISDTLQTLRHTWRRLLLPQQRSFTLASVLTLALGIGAVTSIWSVVYAVLIAPLPFRAPEQVVFLSERNDADGAQHFSVSTLNFQDWAAADTGFSALAGLQDVNVNLALNGQLERLSGVAASSNLWQLLGTPLLAGRAFLPDEARDSAVVIIGERLWRGQFAADPAILTRSITLDGRALRVVGVAAQDLGWTSAVDVWLPLRGYADLQNRGNRLMSVIGRLAPGVSIAQARARLDALAAKLDQQYPESNAGWRTQVFGAREWIVPETLTQQLNLLLVAVLLILLVACINVANLQIARNSARTRELALRQALGASRWRLLLAHMLESVVLVSVGALLGLLLAWLCLTALPTLLPSDTPRIGSIELQAYSASSAIFVSALTSFAFALLPLLRVKLAGTQSTVLSGARSDLDRRRAGLRQALVIAQFTLATVLCVGALQLVQQFLALQNTAMGYQAAQVLTARIALPEASDEASLAQQRSAYDALLRDLQSHAGVLAAGVSNEIPQGAMDTQMTASKLGSEQAERASWRIITGGYLAAMQIPLLAGRNFADSDEASDSVLISAELATRIWADPRTAVGQSLRLGNGQMRTVIGVVGEVRQRGVDNADTPSMYFPTTWYLWPSMALVLRSTEAPRVAIPMLRAAAARAFPTQPLYDISTMDAVFARSIAAPRLQTTLLIGFAISGLLLAAIGIAGVMSYLMRQRRTEFALRLALGALPKVLLRNMLADGVALCLMGLLLGGVLASGLGAWLSSVAVHSSAQIPLSALLTATALLLSALIATWLPARQLLKMQAGAALRGD
jgi:putative ABC transport system permease protein